MSNSDMPLTNQESLVSVMDRTTRVASIPPQTPSSSSNSLMECTSPPPNLDDGHACKLSRLTNIVSVCENDTFDDNLASSKFGDVHKTYEKNPYDKTNNPFGIIQMGLAENQLSFDILESWLKKNPEAMQFKKNGVSNFREIAMFKDPRGLPAFKNALAKFMSMVRRNKVAFDPKNLILTAGATSANEVLMFCIANPGEAILLPTPYYPGFDRDLKWRTGVEIVPIDCTSLNGFKIDESALNKAYLVAKGKNLKVKGVFVTNPSNPLGVSLSLDELHLLVNFVIDKGIHLISDEIFSGTVFKSPNFVSVMEVLKIRNLVNNEVFQRVHIVYSLSKDFGLPGFRAGAIYSNNSIVVSTATRMSNFGLMSSQTQHFLSVMLSDRRFTSLYISQTRKRLKKRQEMLISGLKESGITCLESNAGLFCWVDMRQLLSSNTFEAEYILWKRIVHGVGINISPGSSCHCVEPGWFRICFANISEETLTLAMHRLKSFVDSPSKNDQARHQQQPKIGLSISNSLTRWLLLLLFLHLLGLCFYAFMY